MGRKWAGLRLWCCLVCMLAASTLGAAEVRQFARVPAGRLTMEQGPRDVPVTAQADVVIAGGGVAGVAAALEAAADGSSVILVEERNCLAHEATVSWTMRHDDIEVPATLAAASAVQQWQRKSANASMDPDRCKSGLHGFVAKQGRIRVFFFSLPVGAVVDDGRVRGLVVANRVGRQIFLAKTVIDATDDLRVAASAGAKLAPPGKQTARRMMKIVPPPTADELRKLETLPGFGQDAIVQNGNLTAVTCPIVSRGDAAPDWSRGQAQTLEMAAAVQNALGGRTGREESFAIAPECVVEPAPRAVRADADRYQARGVEGLLLAAPVEANDGFGAALASGGAAGHRAAELAAQQSQFMATDAPTPLAKGDDGPAIKELLAGPDVGMRYPVVHQTATTVPVAVLTDVLVVGGGTSGALAALAAARHQARVVLVEVLPNLGGTSSNRVNSYYWGVPWKSHLSEEVDVPIHVRPATSVGGLQKFRFSGEAKKLSLHGLMAKSGAVVLYRSFGVGAVVRGNQVTGVVVENASGRQVVLARVVIDATGHGDIAAAAGAAFARGRPRDGFLHEAEHGPLRDALDPEDISKFYLRSPQAALSLNLRESRRIVGDCTVTFDDVLADRPFPDVVARWRSNYDTHFPHSANEEDRAQDWAAILGLFRKPLWGSIPYGAILPKGLENILVVGKAYSATHDALIGGRMQRDLQHLGEASGVAAALACRQKCAPRQLPIDQLQAELVRLRVLLPEELVDAHRLIGPTPALDLPGTAARLGGPRGHEAMVDLYRAGSAADPHLLPLLASDNVAQRTEAALVLGMHGRREAAPVLLASLQARDKRTYSFALPNANSEASVPVYCSAVILLGRMGWREAAGPIAEFLRKPDECPPNVASFAIVALGRLGDRSVVPVIRPYLNRAEPASLREENQRFESQWGIRTNAARTLAALGDRSGVPVLIELLAADQSRLRDYAQRLLEEIAGVSHGKDQAAWNAWWRSTNGVPAP